MRALIVLAGGAIVLGLGLGGCDADVGDEDEATLDPVAVETKELGYTKYFPDTFDEPDLWWRLGAQEEYSNWSGVSGGSAFFVAKQKTWIGREFALTGLAPIQFVFCSMTLDTHTVPNPIANGDRSQGKLRVKVRDAVSGTVLDNQQFLLPDYTTWEDSYGKIKTYAWIPPASRRVIVNLIADPADPNRVNMYTVERLALVCGPLSL